MCRRFEAHGWHVTRVSDGNNLDQIEQAIGSAREETERPSLIVVRTHIGYGSPKQDTAEVHGSPLGAEGVKATKERLGWPVEPSFHIPKEALTHFRRALERGAGWEMEWHDRAQTYRERYPDAAARFDREVQGQLPENWCADPPAFESGNGPTHQAVEHLAGLRAIPGLTVIRPADANETAAAWRVAVERGGPVVLVLTRQNVPVLSPEEYSIFEGVPRGAYILEDADQGAPEVVLIGTGSEVHLVLTARRELEKQGVRTRVVSMPSWELWEEQAEEYRQKVLTPGTPKLAVEAGSTQGWHKYVGDGGGVVGIGPVRSFRARGDPRVLRAPGESSTMTRTFWSWGHGHKLAEDLLQTYLGAKFIGEERHRRRLDEIRKPERSSTFGSLRAPAPKRSNNCT